MNKFLYFAMACIAATLVLAQDRRPDDISPPSTSSSMASSQPLPGFPKLSPCDPKATAETASLLQRLQEIRGRKIIFGHHMTTFFKATTAPDKKERWSDVKSTTGEWPAMWSFGMQFAVKYNKADEIRKEIQFARRIGAAITMSWHMDNPVTGGNSDDLNIDIPSILPGGKNHQKLVDMLSKGADFLETLLDDQKRPMPIIMRLWHEHNLAKAFWWNKAKPEELKELWRFTVDYYRRTRNIHNLLIAYCPNYLGAMTKSGDIGAKYLECYPGDDYVDVLGLDYYGSLDKFGVMDVLRFLVHEAEKREKLPAFTETGVGIGKGYANQSSDPDWFKTTLSALRDDPATKQLAYMMTWYNKHGQYWVPYAPDVNGYKAFMEFYKDPWTAFSGDLETLKLYTPISQPETTPKN